MRDTSDRQIYYALTVIIIATNFIRSVFVSLAHTVAIPIDPLVTSVPRHNITNFINIYA
jgi:hypothetical protein